MITVLWLLAGIFGPWIAIVSVCAWHSNRRNASRPDSRHLERMLDRHKRWSFAEHRHGVGGSEACPPCLADRQRRDNPGGGVDLSRRARPAPTSIPGPGEPRGY